MKSPKAPETPDPNVVSAAQTQSNKDTASYNAALANGNTYTPWGSSVFTQRIDPTTGAPVWDQTVSLSPDQQKLIDTQDKQDLELANLSNSLITQAQGQIGKGIDTSNLPGYETFTGSGGPGIQGTLDFSSLPQLYGADDLEGARQQVSDALYKRQAAYLDPQYQQREQALQSRLAAQGITQNSEAWNNAFDEFNRGREFSYGQARDSAISGGGDELARLSAIALANRGQMAGEIESAGAFRNTAEQQALSQALARITANNSTRAQGLQEQFAMRELPLNELNAIRSATAVDIPQFEGASNQGAEGTDVAGNIWNNYNGRLNIYNAKQQSRNALLGGLMGLGGSVGSAYMGG